MKGEYHRFHIAGKLPDSLGDLVRKIESDEGLTDTQIINEAVRDWIQKKQNPTTDQEQILESFMPSTPQVFAQYSREEVEGFLNFCTKLFNKMSFQAGYEGGFRWQTKSTRLSEQASVAKVKEIKELRRSEHL